MAYDGSGRHPALEALKQRAGLAEVIAGHVTATFTFLWAPVSQHQSLGRRRTRDKYIRCIFCVARTSSFTSNASPE